MSTIQDVTGRERKAAKALQAMYATFGELGYLDAVACVRDRARLDDLADQLIAADAGWPSPLFGDAARAVVDDMLQPGPAGAYAVCGYLHCTFAYLHPHDDYDPGLTDVRMHDIEVVYVTADQSDWSTATCNQLDGQITVDTGLPAACQNPAAVADRLSELAHDTLARRDQVADGTRDLDWSVAPLIDLTAAIGDRLATLPVDALAASLMHAPDRDRDPRVPWSAEFERPYAFQLFLEGLWHRVDTDPTAFCNHVAATAADEWEGSAEHLVPWLRQEQGWSDAEIADVLLHPASHVAVYAEHARRWAAQYAFQPVEVPAASPTLRDDDTRLRELGQRAWQDWLTTAGHPTPQR